MALIEARDLHSAQEVFANYKQTKAYFRNLGNGLTGRYESLGRELATVSAERESYKQERDHFRALAVELQTANHVLTDKLEKLGVKIDVPSREPVIGKITVEQIIKAVCLHFKKGRADLVSQRRTSDVVFPRQIGMYLCKQLTTRSLPQIGTSFGRDHTTVLHAIRRIEVMRMNDPEKIDKEVDVITKQLVS